MLLLTLSALPNKVPSHVLAIGQPLSAIKVDQRLTEYCQPIYLWNRVAYQLCVDSGKQVNSAVAMSNKFQCPESTNEQCQTALALYLANFRLWQGSVDNVQRASGYNIVKSKLKKSNVLARNNKKQPISPKPIKKVNIKDKEKRPVIDFKSSLLMDDHVETEAINENQSKKDCQNKVAYWLAENEVSLESAKRRLQIFKKALANNDEVQIEILLANVNRLDPVKLDGNSESCKKYKSLFSKMSELIAQSETLNNERNQMVKQASEVLSHKKKKTKWFLRLAILLVIFSFASFIYFKTQKK